MKNYTKEHAEKMIKDANQYLLIHPNANKKGSYYGMDVLKIIKNWNKYLFLNY